MNYFFLDLIVPPCSGSYFCGHDLEVICLDLIVWPYSGRGLFGVDNGSAQGVGDCWRDDLHSVLGPVWLFKLSKCRGNVGW